jgi:FkbM family methyltransferase
VVHRLARGPEVLPASNGNGRHHPLREQRTYLQLEAREHLPVYVKVRDGERRYTYRCHSWEEYGRATTLFSKEPGTVRWIGAELEPGDVFYDIGANMGIYTIPAAHRVGDGGAVYAFEPHVANVVSLLRNVACNDLQDRVKVLSCALHNTSGFFDFNYRNWTSGSSMSQLEGEVDPYGAPLDLVGSELKVATTADELVERGMIKPATAIKIDVDGNELLILQGMQALLSGTDPPRSVQVEVNPGEREELHAYMESCGFEEAERHLTASGEQALRDGYDPNRLHYNAIFRPTASRATA